VNPFQPSPAAQSQAPPQAQYPYGYAAQYPYSAPPNTGNTGTPVNPFAPK
jgi:hypothetical protein